MQFSFAFLILCSLAAATKNAILTITLTGGPTGVKDCYNRARPLSIPLEVGGGWVVAGQNTNAGTNGPYRYICYFRVTVNPDSMINLKVITDVLVTSHPDASQLKCPRDYLQIPYDVNGGVSGNRIYLCGKSEWKPSRWLEELDVRWSDHAYTPGYSIIHSSLNQGNRGHAMYLYYKATEKEYVTTVSFVYDTSDYHAKRKCINKGENWYLGGFNTNQGTSSKYYIYLCMERVTEPKGRAYLVDAKIVTSESSHASCGTDWDKIHFDLSSGAGGDYVFFCGKWSTTAPQTVADLVVRTPSFALSLMHHESYSQDPKDLNDGAGGDYLHLFYQKR